MAPNRADSGDDAIRLFRRYDRNGSPLPAAAYYSAWLFLPEEVVFDASGSIDGRDVSGNCSTERLGNIASSSSNWGWMLIRLAARLL